MTSALAGDQFNNACGRRSVRGAKAAIVLLSMLSACSDPSVDERAHELIDRLGPMCQHFDFQTKEKVGPGEVRRVWCSEVETTDEHPQFQLIVFSDDETRSQFVQTPATLGHDFGKADWMIVGDDRSLLQRVRDRLVGG